MPPITSRVLRRAVLACVVVALAAPAVALADTYVALGDSYSSGVGTNSYTLSSSCLRSTYAYPYLVAQQRPGTSLTFVACSGATTDTVMSSQIQSVNESTNIVTITVGGNDLRFADLILVCTLADCSGALDSIRNAVPAILTAKLDTVYSAIRTRAPSAKVVVLGYPRLFSGAACFGTWGISASERAKANALADAVDATIAAAAARYDFVYESAIGPFTGHGVCSGSEWVNGLNIFNLTESYHPSRSGQSSGYAPLVISALN